MTIIEQLARYLAARLRLPLEGTDAAGAVFYGCLPARPVRAVCVYASDLRPDGDGEGSRVQIAVRGDADGAWPLERCAEILGCLDGRRDMLFCPGGSYIHRVETERGFEYAGTAANQAQLYVAGFRIYHCA